MLIGRTISHYRIIGKLGEGGMGQVYRAHDDALDRDVALKFLPVQTFPTESDHSRFLDEAKAAAALHHPNVRSVFDIADHDGERFIVMEYIDGRNLRSLLDNGALAVPDAMRIASNIAEGLKAAHRRGIIHRDVKPENILITKDGIAKITDFGLALAKGDAQSSSASVQGGTTAYMPPEVVLGESATFASDVWSFGVVLYEMITGKRPFTGEYDPAITYAILHEHQVPASQGCPGLPAAINELIDRCLEKKEADRFRDAEALLQRLQAVTAAVPVSAVPAMKKLAVLPFTDMSPDRDNQYFSEGLTDEIIASMSKLPGIRILSRATVMQFDRTGKSMKQIATGLGVQYVLEGSVRKSGTDLRITTQLVEAAQDTVLWAEKYNGVLDQIFTIQESVASRVVRALKMRLTRDERKTLKHRATKNTEAYQLYLQGRFFWNKRSTEGFITAIKFFEQAIAKDSHYALAWAGIADSYNLLSQFGLFSRKETYPKARAAVEKALKYDDSLAEAHTSYASLIMLHGWDWETSGKEYRRALELNSNYATAHHWYAEWLMFNGRAGEAIRSIRIAAELDPLSQAIIKDMGMIYYYSRDYDAAIECARKSLVLDKEFATAHRLLSLAFLAKGQYDEAIEENNLWHTMMGNTEEAAASLAYCLAASGKTAEARKTIGPIIAGPVHDGNLCRAIALAYTALAEYDSALSWFEKAWELQAEALSSLKVDPKVDVLRGNPQFKGLLRKIGLEQ